MSEHCATCRFAEDSDDEFSDMEPWKMCARLPETGDRYSDEHEWKREHPDEDDPFDWRPERKYVHPDIAWMRVCHPDSLAFTADGSEYRSALWVRPEFGCVHHEPQDPA